MPDGGRSPISLDAAIIPASAVPFSCNQNQLRMIDKMVPGYRSWNVHDNDKEMVGSGCTALC